MTHISLVPASIAVYLINFKLITDLLCFTTDLLIFTVVSPMMQYAVSLETNPLSCSKQHSSAIVNAETSSYDGCIVF